MFPLSKIFPLQLIFAISLFPMFRPLILVAEPQSISPGQIIVTIQSTEEQTHEPRAVKEKITRAIRAYFKRNGIASVSSRTSVRLLIPEICETTHHSNSTGSDTPLALISDLLTSQRNISAPQLSLLSKYFERGKVLGDLCNTYIVRNSSVDSISAASRMRGTHISARFAASRAQPVYRHNISAPREISSSNSGSTLVLFSSSLEKSSPASLKQSRSILTPDAARAVILSLIQGPQRSSTRYSADPILEEIINALRAAGIFVDGNTLSKPTPRPPLSPTKVPTLKPNPTVPTNPSLPPSSSAGRGVFKGIVKGVTAGIKGVDIFATFPGRELIAVKTDELGVYSFEASLYVTGVIQPIKEGCTFKPSTLPVVGEAATVDIPEFVGQCIIPTNTPTVTPTVKSTRTPGTPTPTPSPTPKPGFGSVQFEAKDSSGLGIAGVFVQLAGERGYAITVTTDASGRYNFLNVPSGTVYLTYILCGKRTSQVLNLSAGEQKSVVVFGDCGPTPLPTQTPFPTATATPSIPVATATPTPTPYFTPTRVATSTPSATDTPGQVTYVTVSGRIVDSVSYSGVPAAFVTVRDVQGGKLLVTQTNSQGYYLFENIVSGGVYELRPSKGGCRFSPSSMEISPFSDQTRNFTSTCSSNGTPTATPTPASGSGILVNTYDVSRAPVGGVSITVTDLPTGRTVGTYVTSNSGAVKIPVPAGRSVHLYPTKNGFYFSQPQTVTAPGSGAVLPVRFYETQISISGGQ